MAQNAACTATTLTTGTAMAELALAGLGTDPVRLIIFDFDGTLSDSGEWFINVIDQLAERFRFRRVDRDEIETLRSRSSREVIRHLGIPAWKLPFISRHVRARLIKANTAGCW